MHSDRILQALDSLAVSTFMDIGRQVDYHGDASRAELFYKRAVRAAETIYGALHGEVGLVLIRLAAFYRLHKRYEEAAVVEERIADILMVYEADQGC
jgi:hypothetical protein